MLAYITDDDGIHRAAFDPSDNTILVLDLEDGLGKEDAQEIVFLDLAHDYRNLRQHLGKQPLRPVRVRLLHGKYVFEVPDRGFFYLLSDEELYCDFYAEYFDPRINTEAAKRLRYSGYFERVMTTECGYTPDLATRVLMACHNTQEVTTVIGTDFFDYDATYPTLEELAVEATQFADDRWAIHVNMIEPFITGA